MMPLGMLTVVAELVCDADATHADYPMVPRSDWNLTLDPTTGLRYLTVAS